MGGSLDWVRRPPACILQRIRGTRIANRQEARGPSTGTSVPFEASRDHRSQDAEIDVWENKTKFLVMEMHLAVPK
jgi:hypothetical protein